MKNLYLINSLLFIGVLMVTCSPMNNKNSSTPSGIDVSGKTIFYEGQTFDEDIPFTDYFKAYITSKAGKEVSCPIPVTFKNCTFNKELSAFNQEEGISSRTIFQGNLTFIGCTFNAAVNFRGLTVNSLCIFEDCKFNETADFQSATFNSEVYFKNNQFLKEVKFQNSYFGKNANFMESQFSETCSFQGSVFNIQAQFGVAKFFGYTDFSLCDFRAGAFFNYAEMPDRIIFNNSIFYQRAEFINAIFNEASMKSCTFTGKNNFDKITIGKSITFDNSIFYLPMPQFDPIYLQQIKADNIITMQQ